MRPLFYQVSLKKIIYQAKFLDLEEREFFEEAPRLKSQFMRDLQKRCHEEGVEVESDEEDEKDLDQAAPKDCELFTQIPVKKLYRKVASLTHPDSRPTDAILYEEYFKLASEAKEKCDLIQLLAVGAELGLNDLINKALPLIEKEMEEKERKISNLKQDVFYKYHKMTVEERQSFMIKIVKAFKKN